MRDELATVPAVIALSRRTRRPVVQHLLIAGVFIAGLVVRDLAGTLLLLSLGVAGHRGRLTSAVENRWISTAALPYRAADPSRPGKDVPLYTV